jgi:type VI secretion system ImpM family protein
VTALQVGAFGKLPTAADFIRLNAGAREVRALDAWLQEGLELAPHLVGPQWASAYDGAPPFRFVLRPRDCRDFLVGAAAPARDAAGRRFPFSVFRLVAEKDAVEAWPLLPLAHAPFLDGAASLLARAGRGEEGDSGRRSLSEEVEALGAWEPERPSAVGARYGTFLRSVTPKALLGVLSRGTEGGGACGRLRALRSALRAVASAAQPRPGLGPRFGLRAVLPAVGEATAAPTVDPPLLVAFWMDLVARSMGGGRRADLVFWTVGEEGRNGRLFLTPPSPQFVASWLDPDRESDRVWDLVPGKAGSEGGSAEGPEDEDCRQLLEGPGATLEELLVRARAWTRTR